MQLFEGKFYYSDVNQDLVKELKLYHKLNNITDQELAGEKTKDIQVPATDDVPVDLDKSKSNGALISKRSRTGGAGEDDGGDLPMDMIDECLSNNQIVEIQKGNYAMVARSGKRIFNQDIRE